ncbi:SDR family oxidoreductase [Runella slithyformis]|uniref:3-oxoacyl-(Acyl-carrier-protein) reductase n=1 Tax=Runella slithyformis (strain ATCC 29530 / DSM 19594 / LMG 11500 / NCIMB 11436 / LSU 4) TaxID=761193 RepID=A0A7U4E6E3_RUNSL|nr:SDR family oxidoreductase [Runella slithyformis]AEI49511.1 3-oxoacyl-(acyl-carrier-protein) reductase [Runella slithyformis DSM 19594]
MKYPENIPEQTQKEQPGLEYKMHHPAPVTIRPNYKGAEKLKNKVALITGGDSGIGRAVAVHFAREGANVAIVCTERERIDAEDTRKMVEDEGKECLTLIGDLKDPAFCRVIVDLTIREFKQLDIVVNNAGIHYEAEALTDISEEQLTETFEVNVFSFFYVIQAALKHLKEGASIINTASIVAYRGSESLMDYAATKGAIVAFTRSLSSNLASKGIRVNGVAPGPIWTPLIVSGRNPEKVKEFGKDTPMERPGQPAELGPAYVFLACEDSSYITGQVIHVNGGTIINT